MWSTIFVALLLATGADSTAGAPSSDPSPVAETAPFCAEPSAITEAQEVGNGASIAAGCTATAECGDGSQVSCSASGPSATCSGFDHNCPDFRGKVTCNGQTTLCPVCPGPYYCNCILPGGNHGVFDKGKCVLRICILPEL